jgi:hypothetical protein
MGNTDKCKNIKFPQLITKLFEETWRISLGTRCLFCNEIPFYSSLSFRQWFCGIIVINNLLVIFRVGFGRGKIIAPLQGCRNRLRADGHGLTTWNLCSNFHSWVTLANCIISFWDTSYYFVNNVWDVMYVLKLNFPVILSISLI